VAGVTHLPSSITALLVLELVFSKREPIYYVTKLAWLFLIGMTFFFDAAVVAASFFEWEHDSLFPSILSWRGIGFLHSIVIVIFEIVYLVLFSMAQSRHERRYPLAPVVRKAQGSEYETTSFENIVLWIALGVLIVGLLIAFFWTVAVV
jgi:hypothetical protein